ncbi:hypothetical protein WN943_010567 [Citrus x changshan-huyou]
MASMVSISREMVMKQKKKKRKRVKFTPPPFALLPDSPPLSLLRSLPDSPPFASFVTRLPLHLLRYRTPPGRQPLLVLAEPLFFFLAQPHLLRYRTPLGRQLLLVLVSSPFFFFFLARPHLLCYWRTSASCYRTPTSSCSRPVQIYNGHDRPAQIYYDVAALETSSCCLLLQL